MNKLYLKFKNYGLFFFKFQFFDFSVFFFSLNIQMGENLENIHRLLQSIKTRKWNSTSAKLIKPVEISLERFLFHRVLLAQKYQLYLIHPWAFVSSKINEFHANIIQPKQDIKMQIYYFRVRI